jgi:hypothetical protein
MNPLIEKYEEVYGKKPVEGGLIEQISGVDGQDTINLGSPIHGGMGNDVISMDNMLSIGPQPAYISVNGSSIIGNNSLTPYTKAVALPHQTAVEHQFFKVLEDVSKGRATVSAISADIDQTFTGFGGQIRYTVEIIGTYP